MTEPDDQARLQDSYTSAVRELLSGAPIDYDLIDRLQGNLLDSLQPPGTRWTALAREAPKELEMALDLLRVLGEVDRSDPALPWNRAAILSDLGRSVEAAEDYLRAADRIASRSSAVSDAGDRDWYSAALHHASHELILAGQPAAAAQIAVRIPDEEYRRELTSEIRTLT